MQDCTLFIYEFKIGLIKIIYEQHDCMYGSMSVSTRLDTRMYVWKRHIAGDPLLFPGSQVW